MKKLFASLFLLFSLFSLFAQKAVVLVSEDFTTSTFPPTGWTIDANAARWSRATSNKAGGNAPELKFSYTNGSNMTSRFISPVINTEGMTSLTLSFKHLLDHYGSGYTVGVATSTDGTNWTSVYSASSDVGPETRNLTLTNGVGSSTFRFCFYFNGNPYQIDYWYVDDVLLYEPDSLDCKLYSINNSQYIGAGSYDVDITLSNLGSTEIDSVEVNYQLNNEPVVTESINGLNFATNSSLNFTFTDQIAATAGQNLILKVWISKVNGEQDNLLSNDTLVKTLHVATQTTSNLPLIESFTSSTCAPCATFNGSFFNNFLSTNEGDLAIIKYQMNWPGSGDPYYTDEGGVRRTFYGVSFVPDLFIGGQNVATNSGAVTTAFGNQNQKDAFFVMNSYFYVVGSKIYVNLDVLPYLSAEDFTIQTAVVEKLTTGNVASNGETSFHYVMMKMLPDASGTTTDFTAETNYNLNFTQDLTSTNVEEFTDLSVMIFIQNNLTQEVFQSVIGEEVDAPTVLSNIPDGEVNIAVDTFITLTFGQPMRFLDDTDISNDEISSFITLTDATKAPVPYTATINNEKTVITITPNSNLPYLNEITLDLSGNAIETDSNITLWSYSTSFTTEQELNNPDISQFVKIYPNPATDVINITNADNSKLEIFNSVGVLVYENKINSDNFNANLNLLSAGNYIVKITNNSGIVIEKIAIVK